MSSSVEVAIVGAGPYGLSIAAHLQGSGVSFRIFGPPMETWRDHMPAGMLLKSDGFASSLSDPASEFTLKHYCEQNRIPYDDTHVPVALRTFVEYGLAFQRRFVSNLDTRLVASIDRRQNGFLLTLEDGETLAAGQVILAVGITHFAHVPAEFAKLPTHQFSHSSVMKDPSTLRGKRVVVLGAGASAVDVAALLHENGANVSLLGRRKAVRFHNPPAPGRRPLLQRLRHPASGLGPGWRSRLCTDVPGLFRLLPKETRLRIVRTHLGPAPGWPMRERVIGKVLMDLGVTQIKAESVGEKVRISFVNADGNSEEILADHVIAATGYRVDLQRLPMLSREVRAQLKTIEDAPVLSSRFESSVPGLYFVGIAAANTFGPMMRFAFGAEFASKRITKHLLRAVPRTQPVVMKQAEASAE